MNHLPAQDPGGPAGRVRSPSPMSGLAVLPVRKALASGLVLAVVSAPGLSQGLDDPAMSPRDTPLRLHAAQQLGESPGDAAQAESRSPQNRAEGMHAVPDATGSAPTSSAAAAQNKLGTPAGKVTLDTRLTPRGFDLQGFQALSASEAYTQLGPLVGREVTLQQVAEVAQRLTESYAARGFPTCFVVVPEQDLANDVIQIQAVEGFVKEIRLEGDPGPLRARVQAIAERALGEHPLRRQTFDRITGLLRQLPGLKAELEVPRATTPDGATTMIVKVQGSHYGLLPGLVQSGNATRVGAGLQERSLTPLGEQLTLSLFPSYGSTQDRLYALSGQVPSGNDGMTLKVDASDIQVTPQAVNVGGGTRLVSARTVEKIGVGVNDPFILRPDIQLAGGASVYATRDRDVYTNPATRRSVEIHSEVRALQFDANFAGNFGDDTIQLAASLVHGLPDAGARVEFIGAAPGLTPEQRVDFSKALQSLTWVHAFGDAVSSVFSIHAQETADTLPPSEQLIFGGNRFALGYPIGEIVGDCGYAAALELGRDSNFSLDWLRFVRPYLAADSAHVHANNLTLVHDTTISAALGVRFGDATRYTVDLSLGVPVGQAPAQSTNRPPHFNSNLQMQF